MVMRDDALGARLTAAANSGEIVRIVYHGGSQSGASREIRPVAVMGDVLRAYDVVSGIEKHFRLSKIELAGDAHVTAPTYDALASSPGEDQRTILDFFAPRVAGLEALGWHVVLLRDALYLHRRFKNGRPRKTPEVEMVRDDPPEENASATEEAVILTISLEGSTITREVRERSPAPPSPWRAYGVRAESLPAARRFSGLSRAAALVLEQARLRAPNQHVVSAPRSS